MDRLVSRLGGVLGVGAVVVAAAALSGCPTIYDGDFGSVGDDASAESVGATVTTGGETCAGYHDVVAPQTIDVVVKNQTGQDIFLPAFCSGEPRLEIEPSSGPDGVDWVVERACLQTCEDLETEPRFACDQCAPRSFRVVAGAEIHVPWEVAGLSPEVAMAASCWLDGVADGTCRLLVGASGAASFDVGASASVACGASGTGTDCACDADGVCNGEPSGAFGAAIPATVVVSAGTVDVVFDGCTFGCPNP